MEKMKELPASPDGSEAIGLHTDKKKKQKKEGENMSKVIVPTIVITSSNTRWSFVNVWEPRQPPNGGKPKYSIILIIPKSDKSTVNRCKAATYAAYEEGASKLRGKGGFFPAFEDIKSPLRDGDRERKGDPAYKDCYFVSASSEMAPEIVDVNCHPILERSEVYSGVYGRACINFYVFNSNGNNGIACGLYSLQKVRDGEPLGSHSRTKDDFSGRKDDDEIIVFLS